ncbi:MAG: YCF48-related protein [Bryobacteraceae bacterium]
MNVRRLVVFLATLFALQCAALHAQNPAGASPPAKFKALWEPVNFGQDINLADVAFTSGEVGWAVGAKSTILHTKDGGKTWEVQLGGDPGSGDRDLKGVFFLDSSHGGCAEPGTSFSVPRMGVNRGRISADFQSTGLGRLLSTRKPDSQLPERLGEAPSSEQRTAVNPGSPFFAVRYRLR